MWLSPLHVRKTTECLWAQEKGCLQFQTQTTGGTVPCVTFIGEEKLNFTFLCEILLSSRNGTSLLEVHSLDSYTTHISPLSLFALTYRRPLVLFLFIPIYMAESTPKVEIINSVKKIYILPTV